MGLGKLVVVRAKNHKLSADNNELHAHAMPATRAAKSARYSMI